MINVAGVRFKKACKVYSFDAGALELKNGDNVIVEVEKGIGLGRIVTKPKPTEESTIKHKLKKIVRRADDVDLERKGFNKEREEEAKRICTEKIAEYKLPMKLVKVEYLFDSSK
ncbi:MAG: stage 0 sporulation protein, partial [Deltaproteobacteria bacterium]|nr:stage 0 sporulation protein [Deltaproteobacteria bacterium]